MEYVGLLNRIDSEDVGESWVEVLMQTFNFSEDPLLFRCLKSVLIIQFKILQVIKSYLRIFLWELLL